MDAGGREMCVNKTYAERLMEAQEFMDLVRDMRNAQSNYYRERKVIGAKVAYKNMINKEYKVDKWLEEHKDETRRLDKGNGQVAGK